MKIENLSAETVVGQLQLNLINGESIIGSIPFDVDPNVIVILPYHLAEEFRKKFKVGQTLLFDEAKPYVQIIKKEFVSSFEIFERELIGLRTENDKPLPNWLEIQLRNNNKPGHLNVKYRIPENEKIFDLGELKIKNGHIILPITFVFLSYAKEDKQEVMFVMQKLHDKGVITWFDEKDLLPGDHWETKIEVAIEKADFGFVFLSSRSLSRSGYKNKELHFILNQYLMKPFGQRYIIPILLDDCEPPRELNVFHWLKLSDVQWEQKILAAIGRYN